MNNVRVAVGVFIISFLSLFVFQKINFLTSDLGRHITSGRLFVQAMESGISSSSLLHTNFFSFTYPQFPFVNHHWGSAVLLYLIYITTGFSGLSLLYGGCLIGAVVLLFFALKQKAPPLYLFPIILVLSPLISYRTEVRPEGFSYLFIALIVSILYLYSTAHTDKYDKYVWGIPVLCFLWVNMHIYFIFGLFIVSAFIGERVLHKDWKKAKRLGIILGLSFVATLINPYGLVGVLYPFTIFQNYGYLIVENQSIPFLLRWGMKDPIFFWWAIATFVFIMWSGKVFLKNKKHFPYALFLLSAAFALLSFFGVRHISAYGIVLFPTFSTYLYMTYEKLQSPKQKNIFISWSVVASFFLCASFISISSSRMPWNTQSGLGLMPTVMQSADFIQERHISGPFFSNYDIGNYIIFNTYPEKVFVDNRPEAYPNSFFKDTYIPMQTNDMVWKKELSRWHFNAIWFYRNDLTQWAQRFLIARVKDPAWAPVFVDEQTIIFLKKNEKNAAVISRYELPKEMFKVR